MITHCWLFFENRWHLSFIVGVFGFASSAWCQNGMPIICCGSGYLRQTKGLLSNEQLNKTQRQGPVVYLSLVCQLVCLYILSSKQQCGGQGLITEQQCGLHWWDCWRRTQQSPLWVFSVRNRDEYNFWKWASGDNHYTDSQIESEEALILSELLKNNTTLRSLCLNYC